MEKVVANPKEGLEEGVRGRGFNANSEEKVFNENLFVVEAWKPKYMQLGLICMYKLRYNSQNGILPLPSIHITC
jgi:hypothetical protein